MLERESGVEDSQLRKWIRGVTDNEVNQSAGLCWSSRDGNLLLVLKELAWLCLKHQLFLALGRISGKDNTNADRLSRGKEVRQLREHNRRKVDLTDLFQLQRVRNPTVF